jgi:sulfoxide reductase heme-binding subunit YedZ
MSKRTMWWVKAGAHLLCALPALRLGWLYRSGAVAAQDDPLQFVQHVTGECALWMLLAALAVTPVRRLSPRLAWMVRLRRLAGLWAFFYATLHVLSYVFLFSGYDTAAAVAGLRAGRPGEVWTGLKAAWPGMLDDVETKGFIQMGLLAWSILLALAVTSPQRVLRAMGGSGWQRLHRLVYVAGFAAVAHFWWQMKRGALTPWRASVVLWVLLGARVAYVAMRRWKRTSAEGKA